MIALFTGFTANSKRSVKNPGTIRFLSIAVGALLLLTSKVAAFEECPPEAAEDLPRVTTTEYGEPLDTPVEFEFQGTKFRIPLGYLVPWPRYAAHKCKLYGCPDKPAEFPPRLRFSFWMPDGRYPERTANFFMKRPCEAGRPRPTDDQYLVSVSVRYFRRPVPDTDAFASYISRLSTRLYKNDLPDRWRIADHLSPSGHPVYVNKIGGGELNLVHYFEDAGDTAVSTKCSTISLSTCESVYWLRAEGLMFVVYYARERVEDRHLIEAKIEALLSQWEVKDPTGNDN